MISDSSRRDIVVVGASAGGVSALQGLFAALPATQHAAFFVVLHIPAHSPSGLDKVLSSVAKMRVCIPSDGDPIELGKIYVGVCDRHLMVEQNVIRVTRGPKECRLRPAIDVLFRSAATAFGQRVIGVVLSGAMDDGTAGLWAVKDRGGIAMVQDPQEAEFGSMPESALKHVVVDSVGKVERLAEHIVALVNSPTARIEVSMAAERHRVENLIAKEGDGLRAGVMNLGKISKYTCPDCHGVLVQIEEGTIVRFRCHTGHAFSLKTLIAEVNESIDKGLWDALRAAEERVMLLRQMAELAHSDGENDTAAALQGHADETDKRLDALRKLVTDPKFFGH
jgi:two-component system chemotaxis response regulator CheB